VKNYVRLHLDRLRGCGISIFFIMVADRPTFFNLKERVGPTIGLVVRDNVGFDFGAWADVLRAFPGLWEAQPLFLINDSVFGPFGPYREMLNRISASDADLIGLTESVEHVPHYQSYFLAFKNQALPNSGARRFWNNVVNLPTKKLVIEHYEMALLDQCKLFGLRTELLFPTPPNVMTAVSNPTHHSWVDLVRAGYPYAKVDLLRKNPVGIVMISDPRVLIGDQQVLKVIDDYLQRDR
jgi:hypothetical protein